MSVAAACGEAVSPARQRDAAGTAWMAWMEWMAWTVRPDGRTATGAVRRQAAGAGSLACGHQAAGVRAARA
ncbi:MAG TPA: hypothetical protein VFQ44_19920 [Streptosporangiaceae bacterium]|nr:hypothetical protein [Streptosporangiaceae bacterium]